MSRGRAYRSNLVPQPVLRAQPDDKIGNWRGLLGLGAQQRSAMSVPSTSRKPPATPQTGRDARLAARRGAFKGQTAGVAPGYVQGNLAILPAKLAGDFLRFCQLNPKPCPLLAASAPRDFRLPTLAHDPRPRTPPHPPPPPAALPAVPGRGAGGRAHGCPPPWAGRPGPVRAGLLFPVGGAARGGRHRAAPPPLHPQGADVTHLGCPRARRS